MGIPSALGVRCLVAAIALGASLVAFNAERAGAAAPRMIDATCVSDGYIEINDGGNVQPAPRYYWLWVASWTSAQGWSEWKGGPWRSVSGGSIRLDVAKGGYHALYVTYADRTSTGWSYSGEWVPITNLTISPIGAVAARSQATGYYCRT